MATDQQAFDHLIKTINEGAFTFSDASNCLSLDGWGLNDSDLLRLLQAANSNKYIISNLKGLILSNNNLTIPPCLGNLNPEHLLLDNNSIHMPTDLTGRKVVSINLTNNPLLTFPNVTGCKELKFNLFQKSASQIANAAAINLMRALPECFSNVKASTEDITPNLQQYKDHIQDYATQARILYQRKFSAQAASFYTAYVSLNRIRIENFDANLKAKILEYLLPEDNPPQMLTSYLGLLKSCTQNSALLDSYEHTEDYSLLRANIAANHAKDRNLIFRRIRDPKSVPNIATNTALPEARKKIVPDKQSI